VIKTEYFSKSSGSSLSAKSNRQLATKSLGLPVSTRISQYTNDIVSPTRKIDVAFSAINWGYSPKASTVKAESLMSVDEIPDFGELPILEHVQATNVDESEAALPRPACASKTAKPLPVTLS
jgi:hypothetical protein